MADTALPVLMYHGLHAGPQARGVFDSVYSVDPREFARQLDWLLAHGYRTIGISGLDGVTAGEQRVLISFDDGDVSNVEIALPLLAQRNMVAEFFVTADFVGRPGMLGANDVRALAAAGMGVQAHGLSHAYLDDLSAAELERELYEGRRRLEAVIGAPVVALALPGGRGGLRECAAAMRAGYRYVFGSEPGDNRRRNEGVCLQRIAVTRNLAPADFGRLVRWRGVTPRLVRLRYRALRQLKRLVGNARYETLRARVLGQ